MDEVPNLFDRVSTRQRPEGWPLMYQSWGKLLFMHWVVKVEDLRPFVPRPLKIDIFDGKAWIAITPFTLWNVRPIFVPPIPGISNFHEMNVRTYVHMNKVPGVWFFSLDANAVIPVIGARTFFHLPYHVADIELGQDGQEIDYRLNRHDSHGDFTGRWSIGDELPQSLPGSLEFFLTERYCLYTEHNGAIYRCRIYHEPWPLQAALLESYDTDIFDADHLPTPDGDPIVHGGGPVHVEVWPLERV